MKKILPSTILAIILIGIAVWALRAQPVPVTAPGPVDNLSGLVFYYGDGCPHCANVEKYFTDNQVDTKVDFVRKEVYNNQVNQAELLQRAAACGIDKNSVGIPLLWHDGQCLTGDTDIINFFERELKNSAN